MASLVADYGSDSSSSHDSDSGEVSGKKIGKALPRPDFNVGCSDGQSVFANPYRAADNAKLAILEKHVKMISHDEKRITGKKMCWYKKMTKCPFGQKCKFSHESDIKVDESKKKSEAGSDGSGQLTSDCLKQMCVNKSKKRVCNDKVVVNSKKTKKTI